MVKKSKGKTVVMKSQVMSRDNSSKRKALWSNERIVSEIVNKKPAILPSSGTAATVKFSERLKPSRPTSTVLLTPKSGSFTTGLVGQFSLHTHVQSCE